MPTHQGARTDRNVFGVGAIQRWLLLLLPLLAGAVTAVYVASENIIFVNGRDMKRSDLSEELDTPSSIPIGCCDRVYTRLGFCLSGKNNLADRSVRHIFLSKSKRIYAYEWSPSSLGSRYYISVLTVTAIARAV